MTHDAKRIMTHEITISAFLFAFFFYVFMHVDDWILETLPSTVSPAFFPSLVTGILAAMSALLTVMNFKQLRGLQAGHVQKTLAESYETEEESDNIISLLAYVGLLFLYLAGLFYCGFVISTSVIMFLVAMLLGLKRWLVGILFCIAFAVSLDWVTFNLMEIRLPQGILFH